MKVRCRERTEAEEVEQLADYLERMKVRDERDDDGSAGWGIDIRPARGKWEMGRGFTRIHADKKGRKRRDPLNFSGSA